MQKVKEKCPEVPGFEEVTDNQGVQLVELLIDGTEITELASPPFAFNAPASITSGAHTIEVRATDLFGTQGSATVQVLVGGPCDDADDCSPLGDTYTCVGGRCVPGPGAPGGLGEPCAEGNDCASTVCAVKDRNLEPVAAPDSLATHQGLC